MLAPSLLYAEKVAQAANLILHRHKAHEVVEFIKEFL
jgi:hypothetical protein